MKHLTPTDLIDAAASVHAYHSTHYPVPGHEHVAIGRYEDVQVCLQVSDIDRLKEHSLSTVQRYCQAESRLLTRRL